MMSGLAVDEDNDDGMGKGRRRLWLLVGHGAVGLATAGAFLPILPTVPFLLVAGWAYARSNPELRERMRNDPRFGPAVREWQDRGAIPVKAKVMAVGGMSSSFACLPCRRPDTRCSPAPAR